MNTRTTTTKSGAPAAGIRKALLRTTVTAGIVTATVLAAPQALGPRTALAASQPRLGECATGELCLWEKGGFKGARSTYDLSGTGIDSCTPLPAGTTAQSVANRTGRPVTTYQSAECAETGEFETYPGGGTWLPHSPYQVRAFKIWEN
ncbi:peptidase inhibitor family I36 protein [Streptomyces sp. NBC_01089]|uniref:peptidase inhibitor family I36 protein n=1 Tax=Streptomyces sp. NBC_01089 TaxID=2903747 RepID=UPI003870CB47|nr:peptidase inhibitor family I36 protein [Streptomyces sp. NBC_01089]